MFAFPLNSSFVQINNFFNGSDPDQLRNNPHEQGLTIGCKSLINGNGIIMNPKCIPLGNHQGVRIQLIDPLFLQSSNKTDPYLSASIWKTMVSPANNRMSAFAGFNSFGRIGTVLGVSAQNNITTDGKIRSYAQFVVNPVTNSLRFLHQSYSALPWSSELTSKIQARSTYIVGDGSSRQDLDYGGSNLAFTKQTSIGKSSSIINQLSCEYDDPETYKGSFSTMLNVNTIQLGVRGEVNIFRQGSKWKSSLITPSAVIRKTYPNNNIVLETKVSCTALQTSITIPTYTCSVHANIRIPRKNMLSDHSFGISLNFGE
jgi:hypothetical protein